MVQAGLLVGVGLALFGPAEPPAEAFPGCLSEQTCIRRPLFLFVVDYSTAMNAAFDAQHTRWQAAVEHVSAVMDDSNGYLPFSAILGLMRFGHDPDIGQPGTPIAGDNSGLLDGHRVDLGFYDENSPSKTYYGCAGEELKEALVSIQPPLGGAQKGIGAWTRGALLRAGELFADAALAHPSDAPRKSAIVLLTQGEWTDASGAQVLSPPAQDPAPVASDLLAKSDVPTFVIAFGDAKGTAAADALAAAGGTQQALAPEGSLLEALQKIIFASTHDFMVPICAMGMPRFMVVIDASSSMLNVGDGPGLPGETSWDRVRAALAGQPSLLDQDLFNYSLRQLVMIGAAVFGAPGEEKLLVDYHRGTCQRDNLGWALDPLTSCGVGCDDPWGGPPITWTFQDGSMVPPMFVDKTVSHMPRCDQAQPNQMLCSGSSAAIQLGLQLVQDNIAQYKSACADPAAIDRCDGKTLFVNVVITDGVHDGADAEVEARLVEMQAAGVTTYVIGCGDGVDDPAAVEQWTAMASWGSAGTKPHRTATTQNELIAALSAVFSEVTETAVYDPCCQFSDECPTDPWDPPESGTSGSTTTTGSTTDVPTDSDTDGVTTTTATTGDPSMTGEPSPTSGTGMSPSGTGELGSTTAETAGATSGPVAIDGCGCATRNEPGEQRLVTLLLFAFAGLLCPKRRARTC